MGSCRWCANQAITQSLVFLQRIFVDTKTILHVCHCWLCTAILLGLLTCARSFQKAIVLEPGTIGCAIHLSGPASDMSAGATDQHSSSDKQPIGLHAVKARTCVKGLRRSHLTLGGMPNFNRQASFPPCYPATISLARVPSAHSLLGTVVRVKQEHM